MSSIKTILLTTDFSETSKKAFAPAVTLGEKFGAEILLAYVEEARMPEWIRGNYPAEFKEVVSFLVTRAEEQLALFAAEHFQGRVEPAVLVGIPSREIVRHAEQRAVDLIVMATHGGGGISQAILGSTTERVLRRSPCPVFVVRDRGTAR